jgi:hypothetical protein
MEVSSKSSSISKESKTMLNEAEVTNLNPHPPIVWTSQKKKKKKVIMEEYF